MIDKENTFAEVVKTNIALAHSNRRSYIDKEREHEENIILEMVITASMMLSLFVCVFYKNLKDLGTLASLIYGVAGFSTLLFLIIFFFALYKESDGETFIGLLKSEE